VTGLQQVDEQHHALVELINRFSSFQVEGRPPDLQQMAQVCDELGEYARYHFTEEQTFMDKLGVDSRHVAHHVREHSEFFLDIARMRAEVSLGRPEAARHLQEFLVHWLAAHILGSDQAMARQIAAMNQGHSPADAFALEERLVDGATGILIKSMNGLSALLSERSLALFELNQTLESRVILRTQELSAVNQRLSRTVERLEAQQKETRRLRDDLAEANRFLEACAMVDRLTGLPNLHYALTRLTSEMASARHFNHPLSIAVFAAEGFKQVNETHGHEAGDEIIRALGVALRMCFRSHDVVCHVGVEEFIVICPLTTYAGTVALTDKVRAALSDLVVPVGPDEWRGHASAGIAEFGPDFDTVTKLIQAATTRRWPLES